jgi:hypothetical protein
MIYTAYFDESDSHGPKPDLVMSAFLASARQWELFERKLKRMQTNEGFNIFHAKDYRARRGEFRDWDEEKWNRVGWEFATLMADELTRCATVVLPHDLYQGVYRAPPVPHRMPLDSQYGLCFRMCLLHFIEVLEEGRDKLQVVIESGHKNAQDTVRIFGELKAVLTGHGVDFLRTIKVARKEEALPLMAADFNAHLGALQHRVGEFDKEGDETSKRKAFHSRLVPTSDYLGNLKQNWSSIRERLIEKRRGERVTRAKITQ